LKLPLIDIGRGIAFYFLMVISGASLPVLQFIEIRAVLFIIPWDEYVGVASE